MRAVADGRLAMGPGVREHLELCLDCRACESACPSGRPVRQDDRAVQDRACRARPPAHEKASWLRATDPAPPVSRIPGRVQVGACARAAGRRDSGCSIWAERIGLTRLLPPTLRRMQAMLPTLSGSHRRLPEVLPPIGPKRARVALFLGCVADAMFPETNAATARVLQENGCEVVIPRGQVCCGAIHYHSGVEQPALELARQNWPSSATAGLDAIIVNAAGCGAMLKDYAHILPEPNRTTRPAGSCQGQGHLRVPGGPGPDRAQGSLAAQGGLSRRLPSLPRPADPQPAAGLAGDDTRASSSCRSKRARSAAAPPAPITSPSPRCPSGSASARWTTSRPPAPRMVVTGNVGCILQIARKIKERGSPIEVAHPVDLLDRAYRGESDLSSRRLFDIRCVTRALIPAADPPAVFPRSTRPRSFAKFSLEEARRACVAVRS